MNDSSKKKQHKKDSILREDTKLIQLGQNANYHTKSAVYCANKKKPTTTFAFLEPARRINPSCLEAGFESPF